MCGGLHTGLLCRCRFKQPGEALSQRPDEGSMVCVTKGSTMTMIVIV